jgi:hypothetical protein
MPWVTRNGQKFFIKSGKSVGEMMDENDRIRKGQGLILESYWNEKVHPMGSQVGFRVKRKELDPSGYRKSRRLI